jgi:hypothetical protein
MDDLKELINSQGWYILKEKLLAKRQAAMNELITETDPYKITQRQIQIQELDFLMKLPKQLILENQTKEKTHGRFRIQDALSGA